MHQHRLRPGTLRARRAPSPRDESIPYEATVARNICIYIHIYIMDMHVIRALYRGLRACFADSRKREAACA